jgi:hypothetical protein
MGGRTLMVDLRDLSCADVPIGYLETLYKMKMEFPSPISFEHPYFRQAYHLSDGLANFRVLGISEKLNS